MAEINGLGNVTAAGGRRSPADEQAKAIVNRAVSQFGYKEGSNNSNPFTKMVMNDENQPWCAAFASVMLGNPKRFWSASTRQLADQFQSEGRYFPSDAKPPQPGDVIFFGARGSEHHTGIVTKVENGKVYTIEGNSSDQVSARSYELNDPGIGGYGRVIDGEVSNDLGLTLPKASEGKSGGRPSSRASRAGSASNASETGVDYSSYFAPTSANLFALILAILNGKTASTLDALKLLFPFVSLEDLAVLGALLEKHPDLLARIGSSPELLQQLLAAPTEETVERMLKMPVDRGPLTPEATELVKRLLDSPELAQRTQVLDPLIGRYKASKAAWQPLPGFEKWNLP